MLGTPYYMSPEQWGELPHDGNSEIDGRADIYSLGCVLYEIIAARRPFNGMTLAELRRQHVSVTPDPLNQIAPDVPESFSRVIARAIAKDRQDRQSTAGELEQELISALSAEGISATPSLAALPSERSGPVSSGVVTSPQQTAATMLTGIDQAAEAPVPSQASTMPTVIAQPKPPASPTIASGIAMQPAVSPSAAPAPVASAPVAPRKKGSALLTAGVGLVVLLLIAGVGGYFVMNTMMKKPATDTAKADTSSSATGADLAAAHEAGRYWLQVKSGDKSDVKAAESLTMTSGQQFKFHFSPSENGYIYIVGPGNHNAPTTFLTDKPDKDFGVTSNEIKSGEDFSFPADSKKDESWMNLDEKPGTDEFTVIFSGTKLTTPAFLKEKALHELNDTEQKELADLVNQSRGNLLGTEVIKTGASPFVSVKVPQTATEGAPIVFKIRIEHK
jgi:hypothetical protein